MLRVMNNEMFSYGVIIAIKCFLKFIYIKIIIVFNLHINKIVICKFCFIE